MTLQKAVEMGYAPPQAVRSLIARFRDQGLPSPLTVETIQRVGVTESLAPRTIKSLKLLGLLDGENKTTERFERLRLAPTAEFKTELVDLLRWAYAPVFEVVEPSKATYEDVQDAFRTFKPAGQRDRMVALFLALLEYAEYAETLPSPSGRAASNGRTGATTGGQVHRLVKKNQPSNRASSTKDTPAQQTSPPPPPPPLLDRTEPSGEKVAVKLGQAGTVTVYVDVRWLDLPDSVFTALRQAIRTIENLAYDGEAPDSAPPTADATSSTDGEGTT